MAKDYTKTLGEFDKKLVTLPKAKSAAKKAADSIKTDTVKKTDNALGKDAKMLPKSKSEKKLPKASKVLESVKKSFLGSSYVAPDGTKPAAYQGTAIYTEKKRANPSSIKFSDGGELWNNIANEKGISGTFGRTLAGIGEGFVDASTSIPSFVASTVSGKDVNLKKSMGLELPKSADGLKDTTAFKVGELGGNLLGYGAQNIAAAPAVDALLAKTKLGQMAANAGSKLANTGVGRLAGEEAAKNFTTGMARNAVEAGTIGLGQNIGMAAQEGLTGGDAVKDVLLNTGIDLVAGSALEALPLAGKTVKRTASDWLNERNAKKVLETATPQVDEVIDTAKKVDVNQSVKATEVDNATLPKKSKKNLLKTENQNTKADSDNYYIKNNKKFSDVVTAIEKRSGVKVIISDLPEGFDGVYNDGVITISRNANNPSYTVLKHELTHHIETSGNYQELSDFIVNSMKQSGYDVDAALKSIRENYASHGIALKEGDDVKEFVAKFSEEFLFNSEKSIERLSRENPGLFRRIYDWIVDTIHKIGASDETKFLIDVQRKYEKALMNTNMNKTRNPYNQYSVSATDKNAVDLLVSNKHIVTDSDGTMLTNEQQKYFENSKVRDENGRLKRMYHGTSNAGFTVFEPWGKTKYGLFGSGSYFTDNPEVAISYTGKGNGNNPDVYEVYLNITNPIDMDAPADIAAWKKAFPFADFPQSGTNEEFYRVMEEFFRDEGYYSLEAADTAMDVIESMGYDGITHIGGGRFNKNDTTRHRVYIAFRPEQIKRINNANPTDHPDIRYSLSESKHNTYRLPETDYIHRLKFASENLYDKKNLPKKSKNNATKSELPKSRNGKELKPGGADVLKADMSVEEIAYRYGTYKGSKVPKATDMGDVSQSANTLYYAEMMDDKAKEALLDGVKAGDYWKTTVKNKTVIDEAKDAIGSDLEGTLDSFLSVSKSGKQATSRDIAKGYALAEEYIKKGDYATVENILADVGMMESEAGRTLQAMRIFNSQTPAGRVKSALKSVQKIESDHGIKIKVNQKLLDDVMNATSDAEKLTANKAFAVDVWNQVPATLGEKLNAWRYLSMLGNPKTHIRNILGNAIFYPFRVFSDSVATGLEKALGKKIAKVGGNKSKAIVGITGNDRELRKLAKSEYNSHRTAMEAASSKYIESLRPQEAKLYKAKSLEGLRRSNSRALEKEDQIFMGMSFESAFSQYCKANGKKASEVTGKFRDEAIAYAQRRALESTYRDPNALASAISKFKKNFDIKKTDSSIIKFGKKTGEIVSESVLPFVKTPANILKRGVEYSPAGILGGAAKIATAKDAETLMKGIEYFASGLTGTGVMIAGYWLGKSGIVNGGMGEYDKVKAYNQMLGDQDYSINIGDKTFTIDWMAPMSMPFFVGVEVAGAEGEERDMWETIEAMSTITDPLFEMSMLSGIDNVFDTAFSEGSPIVNVGKNAIQNYVSQYVPTLAGQIARTITKDRKTTLSTANSDLEKWANKGLDKLTNKVPGLTELNQPYIDQWGRRDSKQNASDYAWSAVENMLSPGYISERNETSVDKELKRLTTQLDEEDAKGIIPAVSSSAYKVKFEGKEYSMTESEFTKYKETVGQYRYNALHELFSTKEYKQASADEKRKMIMNVYEEGTELGKEKYLVGTGKTTKEKYDYSKLSDSQKEKVDESGISATKMRLAVKAIQKADAGNGKAIEKAYALDEFSDDVKSAYGLSDKAIKSANKLKSLGIEYNDFEETANKIDTNENGGYTVDEITSYLNSTNKYTRQQKAAIFAALSKAKYNPYL